MAEKGQTLSALRKWIMPNLAGRLASVPLRGPCSHGAKAPCIEVVSAKYAKHLRLHTCGPCQQRWWECNGKVIGLSEALRIIGRAARATGVPREPPPRADGAAEGSRRERSATAPFPDHIDLVDLSPLGGSPGDLLLPREVAAIFAVCPRTIARWADRGLLATTRTAKGHLRFRRGDVLDLREGRRLKLLHRAPSPLTGAGVGPEHEPL